MPFFHYTASDSKGAQVEGTIQASGLGDAERLLANRGFHVTSIAAPRETSDAGARLPYPPTAITSPQAARPTISTRTGTDKERFFLFAQIAQQLKAGIAPAQAFPTLAAQLSNEGYAESLRRIAAQTAEGTAMSEVMAMYPELYPEHVVGLVRAGEIGGFLPDACAAVSEQAGAAHKFRMSHWFLWFAVISTLAVLPTVLFSMLTFNSTFWKMWKGNADVDSGWVLHEFFLGFLKALIGPGGIIILVLYLALYIFYKRLNMPTGRRLRHTIGFRIPLYGKRATHEGVTLFTWSLANLSRSGIPPQTAWALAAQCAPNMCLREQLVEAGRMMQANSRVSEAVFRSHVFSEEYAPMISTGEMTGDLPGTLERLAQVSRGNFDDQTQTVKWRAGCWSLLMLGIAAGGGMIILYYCYGRLLTDLSEHGAD